MTANTTLQPGVENGTNAKSWQSSPCPRPKGIVAANIVTAHQSSPSVEPRETRASAVASARPACPNERDLARFDDSTCIFWTNSGEFMGIESYAFLPSSPSLAIYLYCISENTKKSASSCLLAKPLKSPSRVRNLANLLPELISFTSSRSSGSMS